MSSIESYDGLCGIIATFASSDLQLRCNHSMGHHGNHSWEKYRDQFRIIGGTGACGYDAEQGFLNSVYSEKK